MKFTTITSLAVLAIACASTLYANESRTIPAQFHGTWTWNKSGVHPDDVEQPLRISSSNISAHETSGKVVGVAQSGAGGNTYFVNVIAACEGMEGKEQLQLILSPDGTRLTLQQERTNTCSFGAGDYYRVR
jgi:hypothetical protein